MVAWRFAESLGAEKDQAPACQFGALFLVGLADHGDCSGGFARLVFLAGLAGSGIDGDLAGERVDDASGKPARCEGRSRQGAGLPLYPDAVDRRWKLVSGIEYAQVVGLCDLAGG